MHKNLASFLFVLIFCCSMFCESCKKEQADTQASRLVGNWKKIQYATDDNNNGILDAQEIHNVQVGFDDYMFFKADSTGSETVKANGETSIYAFRWNLPIGDSLYRQGVGHLNISYYIVDITSSNLTLVSNQSKVAAWYIYAKM